MDGQNVAIEDKEGNVIANKGNSDLSVFMRSCAKPFQALPLIKSKSFPMLQVSSSQLAVIVASHTGEKIHINVLQDLLTKNHMTSKMLTCGLH